MLDSSRVLVTTVIPAYQAARFIARALESAIAQNIPAHEIVVVDDGSTDGTRDWLTTLGGSCRVLLNERNLGYAGANNRGVAAANKEIVALLNNDLILPPRWLEPMLAVHRRLGARAGLVGNVQLDARTGQVDHAGIFINLKGKPEHDRREAQGWGTLLHGWHEVDALTGACLLLARETWHRLGGFDEGFRNGGEDVDLCFRARRAGLVNAVADRSAVRHHVSSSPGRALRNEENSRRLTLRWRAELVDCAARHWCRHYFESSPLDPGTRGHGFEFQVWLHTLGLRREPPPAMLAAMRRIVDAAVDVELARWDTLLGPA
jgi:GT2 family glycosyltransferase